MPLIVLGLLGAAAWFWVKHRYPAGHGPFDTLPAALGKRSAPTLSTAPSSGLRYEVYTYPTGQSGHQFEVATLKDHLGWVSYFHDQSTGKRTYYAGWTPNGGPSLDVLEKDFAL
jgi:hypothetical protein